MMEAETETAALWKVPKVEYPSWSEGKRPPNIQLDRESCSCGWKIRESTREPEDLGWFSTIYPAPFRVVSFPGQFHATSILDRSALRSFASCSSSCWRYEPNLRK